MVLSVSACSTAQTLVRPVALLGPVDVVGDHVRATVVEDRNDTRYGGVHARCFGGHAIELTGARAHVVVVHFHAATGENIVHNGRIREIECLVEELMVRDHRRRQGRGGAHATLHQIRVMVVGLHACRIAVGIRHRRGHFGEKRGQMRLVDLGAEQLFTAPLEEWPHPIGAIRLVDCFRVAGHVGAQTLRPTAALHIHITLAVVCSV